MKKPLLQKVFEGKKVPREAPPPSKWGRGRSGVTFTTRKVGFRNRHGKKLYRLGFFVQESGRPTFSSHLWTLEELNAQKVEWLPECPVGVEIEVGNDQVDVPRDALLDDEVMEVDEEPAGLTPEQEKTLVTAMAASFVGNVAKKVVKEVAIKTGMEPFVPVIEAAIDIVTAFSARYPWKIGDKLQHTGGKIYRILAIVDADTVRVQQVLESGAATPARNMKATALRLPS